MTKVSNRWRPRGQVLSYWSTDQPSYKSRFFKMRTSTPTDLLLLKPGKVGHVDQTWVGFGFSNPKSKIQIQNPGFWSGFKILFSGWILDLDLNPFFGQGFRNPFLNPFLKDKILSFLLNFNIPLVNCLNIPLVNCFNILLVLLFTSQ